MKRLGTHIALMIVVALWSGGIASAADVPAQGADSATSSRHEPPFKLTGHHGGTSGHAGGATHGGPTHGGFYGAPHGTGYQPYHYHPHYVYSPYFARSPYYYYYTMSPYYVQPYVSYTYGW